MNAAHYYIGLARKAAECVTVSLNDINGTSVGAVAVRPSKRSVHIVYLGSKVKGGGTKLMDHVKLIAGDRPITVLADVEAVGFYTKMGFRVTRRGESVHRMRRG